jgi:predicted site-specific integrase-resolvase
MSTTQARDYVLGRWGITLSPSTLCRWMRVGHLSAVKENGRWQTTKAAIEGLFTPTK